MSTALSTGSSNEVGSGHGQVCAPVRAAPPDSAPELNEQMYWRRYFAESNLEGSEVRLLEEEGQRLTSILSKAFPNNDRATWTYESLRDAVARSQQTWETKERLGKGKPQKLFHTLMQKFDIHSHLFQVIPQEDIYTSLITGGTAIIVKASVNHSKTIEELSNALNSIGEVIGRCSIDSQLIRSTLVQDAVAKLYIEVFKFLGEAAMWYTSSSTSKVLNSLHRDFSERFRSAVDTIAKRADDVHQLGQLGSRAEIRVARLQIEELSANLGRAHSDLSGHFAAVVADLLRRNEEIDRQHGITRNLLKEALPQLAVSSHPDRQMLTEPCNHAQLSITDIKPTDVVKSPSPSLPGPETHSVSEVHARIGAILGSQAETPSSNAPFAHHRLFRPQLLQAIYQWLTIESNPLMYLEYQSSIEQPDTVTAVGHKLSEGLRGNGVACVFIALPCSPDPHSDPLKHLFLQIASKLMALATEASICENLPWPELGTASSVDDLSFLGACEVFKRSCKLAPNRTRLILSVAQVSLGANNCEHQAQDFWDVLRSVVKANSFRVLMLARGKVESLVKSVQPDELKTVLVTAKSQMALAPLIVPRLKES